jgi:hypothetical protein
MQSAPSQLIVSRYEPEKCHGKEEAWGIQWTDKCLEHILLCAVSENDM